MRSMKSGIVSFLLIALPGTAAVLAQKPEPSTAAESKGWTTKQDHQNMMDQLGIKKLRPGPNASEDSDNPANYDESLANPYPILPDPLTLKNGQKVTTAEMWWKQRRPEIVEDFEREVLGRVPPHVPEVTWKVAVNSLSGTWTTLRFRPLMSTSK